MPSLPSRWSTTRATIRDATLADVPALHSVFDACRGLEPFDPGFAGASQESIRELVQRSLTGRDNAGRTFHLQAIVFRERTGTRGYFHLSYAHPRPATVWISMFVLHPEHQASGYGSEVVHGLIGELGRSDAYDEVWLRVYLGNVVALRFWIRCGFTEIVRFDGPDDADPDRRPSLVLASRLRRANTQPPSRGG